MSLICLTNGKTHSQKLIVPPVICNFTGLLNPLRLRYLQKHFEDSQATFEGIHVVTPIAIGCCAAIPGPQFAVAKGQYINVGRSTFRKILRILIPLLDRLLCQDTIFLQMSSHQMQKSRQYFFRSYQLLRIVVCVDETHIGIRKLVNNPSVFYNRKGYYSFNVMVVSTMSKFVIL